MKYKIKIKNRYQNGNGIAAVCFEDGPEITYRVCQGKSDGRWYAIGPKEKNEKTGKVYSTVWYGSIEMAKKIEKEVIDAFNTTEDCPV